MSGVRAVGSTKARGANIVRTIVRAAADEQAGESELGGPIGGAAGGSGPEPRTSAPSEGRVAEAPSDVTETNPAGPSSTSAPTNDGQPLPNSDASMVWGGVPRVSFPDAPADENEELRHHLDLISRLLAQQLDDFDAADASWLVPDQQLIRDLGLTPTQAREVVTALSRQITPAGVSLPTEVFDAVIENDLSMRSIFALLAYGETPDDVQ